MQQAPNPWDPNDINSDKNLIWHHEMAFKVQLQHEYGVKDWDWWLSQGMDKDSVVADPLFVDADRHDYRLKPESPAWKLGFKEIPSEKIGLNPNLPYRDLNQ
jgi:hypothetical protein